MLRNSAALLVVVLARLSICQAEQARGFIPPELQPDTSLYHLVPQGVILLWSGPVHLVPRGWAVCDGTQGTPDLRDRFVIGSGPNAQFTVGQKGGASSVTPVVTVRPTRLTIAQMPEHARGGVACTDQSSNTTSTSSCLQQQTIVKQGNNEAHTHEASASPVNVIPPFHALIYIMKT